MRITLFFLSPRLCSALSTLSATGNISATLCLVLDLILALHAVRSQVRIARERCVNHHNRRLFQRRQRHHLVPARAVRHHILRGSEFQARALRIDQIRLIVTHLPQPITKLRHTLPLPKQTHLPLVLHPLLPVPLCILHIPHPTSFLLLPLLMHMLPHRLLHLARKYLIHPLIHRSAVINQRADLQIRHLCSHPKHIVIARPAPHVVRKPVRASQRAFCR
mmetsp:Transcript_3623/g.7943  ORF Transcript_3623/g.7943 Transcript_3623/m.7943 type:complete len:220 (-) Transcript_3623:1201-1860(-)